MLAAARLSKIDNRMQLCYSGLVRPERVEVLYVIILAQTCQTYTLIGKHMAI